jgi:hypothetical protein
MAGKRTSMSKLAVYHLTDATSSRRIANQHLASTGCRSRTRGCTSSGSRCSAPTQIHPSNFVVDIQNAM